MTGGLNRPPAHFTPATVRRFAKFGAAHRHLLSACADPAPRGLTDYGVAVYLARQGVARVSTQIQGVSYISISLRR